MMLNTPELQIWRNWTVKACILVDYLVGEKNNINAFFMQNVEVIQCQMKVDILCPFRNVSDRCYLISPWNLRCSLSSSTSTSLSGNECTCQLHILRLWVSSEVVNLSENGWWWHPEFLNLPISTVTSYN